MMTDKSNCKLGLGTVQWGLHYGIANQDGIVKPETVTAILAEAHRRGISVLDTASRYGKAEEVLGANPLGAFRIVTKTPRFATPAISDEQSSRLVQVFQQSLERLALKKVYGLLVHHVDDLLVPGGEKLVAAMVGLKKQGLVEKVGVSVYSGEQVDAVLRIFSPDIVQLPLSVLDQRMLLNGHLERLKQRKVEIHSRSVFLQGLLLMPLDQVPAYFNPIRPLLKRWHMATVDQGVTPTQAALSFVRDISMVDTVLVGVENLGQFQSCFEDFSIDARFDSAGLACNDPLFVNPALWKVS